MVTGVHGVNGHRVTPLVTAAPPTDTDIVVIHHLRTTAMTVTATLLRLWFAIQNHVMVRYCKIIIHKIEDLSVH